MIRFVCVSSVGNESSLYLNAITLIVPGFMKYFAVPLFTVLLIAEVCAQEQDDPPSPSPLTISGYVEVYYAYDFHTPANHTRPSFLYTYNRHNEVNINHGYIQTAYATERVRANLGLMAGTYANANLAAEPGVLKNVWEANAGVRLSATKKVWLDAGVFSSHIGFESAAGKDCWTLSRSLQAETSPYYEAGARLSYTTASDRWYFAALLLNGWQRIQRPDGNSTPASGTQVTFKPNDNVILNSSTFIGSDRPDSLGQVRYFHNLYAILQLTERIGVTAAFDYGIEEKPVGMRGAYTWWTSQVIVRGKIDDKVTVALRVEYDYDPNGVIVMAGPRGFRMGAASVNVDYHITDKAVWRVEARGMQGKDAVFGEQGNLDKGNVAVVTAVAVFF